MPVRKMAKGRSRSRAAGLERGTKQRETPDLLGDESKHSLALLGRRLVRRAKTGVLSSLVVGI